MRLRTGLMALALGLAACGTDDGVDGESTLPADTLTAEQQRARRDSAVAESRLPGAEGVGRAMDARTMANERNAAHDSLQ